MRKHGAVIERADEDELIRAAGFRPAVRVILPDGTRRVGQVTVTPVPPKAER